MVSPKFLVSGFLVKKVRELASPNAVVPKDTTCGARLLSVDATATLIYH